MDTPSSGQQIGTLFISYSRKDKEFVHRLNDALDKAGYTAWVDWEGIAPSADWREEIRRAVQSTDAIVFVLSPDFAKSKECDFEVKLALEYNKKLIPVMYRPLPKGAVLHEKLSATNWIFMREGDRFKSGIDKIVESVRTDLEWVRLHTRLLQRALEWEERGRSNSSLLMGAELDEAERWMTEAASQEEREVLPLQAEYIAASRRGVVRRGRRLLIGVSFALAVSIALGLYALALREVAVANEQAAIEQGNARATQQAIAEANADLAEKNRSMAEENAALAKANESSARAQRSAAQAQLYRDQPGQLDTSVLLAVASWQRERSAQAEDLLRHGISLLPPPIASGRQADQIKMIAYAPDGASFVSASLDGTACVWDADGAQRFCVEPGADVNDALFIRDGQVLVTAAGNGAVEFWSMADGSPLARYEYPAAVMDIDDSSDGFWLAVGRADNAVSIINLRRDRKETDLEVRGLVYSLEFSPNSAWLAIGTDTGSVRQWRVMTDIWLSGPQHQGEVYAVAFSPDGLWLASIGSDNMARVALTGAGGQQFVLPHDDWVEALAFSPNSKWLVTASDDNLVRVWSLKNGQELLRMRHADYAQEVAVSPDGRWIATTGFDNTARIWSAATGEQALAVQMDTNSVALAFSPDGRRLAAGDERGKVSLWDLSALSALAGGIDFPQVVHRALFSPDGAWLAVNTDDKNVLLFDADPQADLLAGATGRTAVTAGALTYDMAVSPDSKWLAVVEDSLKRVSLYDAVAQTVTKIPLGSNALSVAFSPDSRMLALGSKDGGVVIWNLADGAVEYSFQVESAALSLSFHPGGRWLAIGLSEGGTLGRMIIWDLAARSEWLTIVQPGNVDTVAFSPAGDWLVSSGPGGGIYLRDARGDQFALTARMLGEVDGNAFAFHPSRPWLAAGSEQGLLYLIDLERGEELARLPQAGGVAGVSFSADGTLLAVAARKSVKFWRVDEILAVPRDALDTTACARLTENFSSDAWEQLFFDEPYRLICPLLPGDAP